MAHTSDWEYVTEISYVGDYPYSKAHRVKMGSETLTIGAHGTDWKGEFELEARARLIAAAPDLLEACEWALNYLQTECGDITTRKLREAIAKAKGE